MSLSDLFGSRNIFCRGWRRLLAMANSRGKPDDPYLADEDTFAHLLLAWSRSCWLDYDRWLARHALNSLPDWRRQNDEARSWRNRPLISLLTPVFNTAPEQLAECIDSVRYQTYPDWELCLIDDGSTRPETLSVLKRLALMDHRIRIKHQTGNSGICAATNVALSMARGAYIAFLDHDDRLTPDALFHIAATIIQKPDTDIVYSDRDMISEQGQRFMHLFKPDWSPETLLSGNYLFHVMVYRRSLLECVGGLDARYEGSQDYDLILRASDNQPSVSHIPRVLYSWRQHVRSVSLNTNDKAYAFASGLRALTDTLTRRGLNGTVEEIPHLWRGNYRIRLRPPEAPRAKVHRLPKEFRSSGYRGYFSSLFASSEEDFIVLLDGDLDLEDDAIEELLAWFSIKEIGMVTGKVIDCKGHIVHAGLVQRQQGHPLSVYQGFPESEPGYMAVTSIARNVSLPHPYCVAIRRDYLLSLGGLSEEYDGPQALHDLALRGLVAGYRYVFNPFSRFRSETIWADNEIWSENERQHFAGKWQMHLISGDPYYNQHLSLEQLNMGLALSC